MSEVVLDTVLVAGHCLLDLIKNCLIFVKLVVRQIDLFERFVCRNSLHDLNETFISQFVSTQEKLLYLAFGEDE